MKTGTTFLRKGQTYRYLGERDHLTRADRLVQLALLGSRCAECGAPFRFTTTKDAAARGGLNRRCDQHKKPGVPVAAKSAAKQPPEKAACRGGVSPAANGRPPYLA